MALPHSLRLSLTPPELELVACQHLIEIVPLISMEKTAFISVHQLCISTRVKQLISSPQGAYGPLRPPNKTKVPIWIAVDLKLKKKCHIIPPDWLQVDYLQEKLTLETTETSFSSLPFRFAEIAKVILDAASDDVENPDKLRSLLKDIREARQAKSREGLRTLDHSELSLSNLCSMEINEIRPYFVQSMSVLTQLVRSPVPDPLRNA